MDCPNKTPKGMRLVWISLIALPLVGCGWISPPNWYHPGTADYQRQQAVQFDPYPEDDTGPPVVGGRPLGYQNPIAEPARARQQTGWGIYSGGSGY